MMQLTGSNDLSEQHILFKQMRLYLVQFGRVLQGLEGQIGGRRARVLDQESRAVSTQIIQLGIAPLVTHVETKALPCMESTEQIIVCRCLGEAAL
jgi:hypothetical protein